MADVTIFKPAEITVAVIEGSPPVDQSALVAELQAQVSSLEANLETALSNNAVLVSQRDEALGKIANAQAALA